MNANEPCLDKITPYANFQTTRVKAVKNRYIVQQYQLNAQANERDYS